MVTIDEITQEPKQSLVWQSSPCIDHLSFSTPISEKMAFYLDHTTTLEEPQVDNRINAIIHKLSLIDIKLLRDLHLNLVQVNHFLNNTILQ